MHLDRRTGWGQGRANSVSLRLAPLAPATMRDLLLGVVTDTPAPLVDRLVERSGGIPLYAVETVRMLIDEGRLVEEGRTEEILAPEPDYYKIGLEEAEKAITD